MTDNTQLYVLQGGHFFLWGFTKFYINKNKVKTMLVQLLFFETIEKMSHCMLHLLGLLEQKPANFSCHWDWAEHFFFSGNAIDRASDPSDAPPTRSTPLALSPASSTPSHPLPLTRSSRAAPPHSLLLRVGFLLAVRAVARMGGTAPARPCSLPLSFPRTIAPSTHPHCPCDPAPAPHRRRGRRRRHRRDR
jgi:hypothetical protein